MFPELGCSGSSSRSRRGPRRVPAEAQSLRLSAAVRAACGCVPRGQRALLDADMNALIDRSSCLVEPVLVLSSARARRTEHVQRRVRSLLANIPSRGLVARGSFPEPLCCRCDLVAASRTPLLEALITTAALQVVMSCDMCFLFQRFWSRCDSGVLELFGCAR